jgi:hypothetical protein
MVRRAPVEDPLMEPSPSDQPSPAEAERDALRVQTAAVAAQQMALTLEEEKLRQRGAALERQEAQLAAHLQERRERLLELQEQVRRERDVLKTERAALQAEREEQVNSLAKQRAEAVTATEAAQKERTRLIELRKRLRVRWKRHWDARDAEFARREEDLTNRRADLSEQADNLRRERARLSQTQRQVNSEVELGRRKLQEGWEELSLNQQQWDVCLNSEHTLRQCRVAELEVRENAVAAAEQNLTENQRLWTRKQIDATREVEGLETRVVNLRSQLALLQPAEILPWPVSAHTAQPPASAIAGVTVPQALERLSAELGDQRRHLLEQWGRLLTVQSQWEIERVALLGDLDATARRFDERERALNSRESKLAGEEIALRHRQQATEHERNNLEGWRARFAVREAAAESERSDLLSEVRGREESADRQTARLHEMRERWLERRRHELEELRAVRQRCEHARGVYLEMWHECQARRTSLAREQREIATKELALERLRQDLLRRAPDAAAAERRLAKLMNHTRAAIDSARGEVEKGQQAVLAEIGRLDGEWRRLQEEEAALLTRTATLDQLRDELEQSRAVAQAEGDDYDRELRSLRDRHDHDAREIAALREEVEVIARHLIGEDGVSTQEQRHAA